MEQRVNIAKDFPEAYKSMYALSGSLNHSSLTPLQKEMIKIRASQINQCAFCLNMHTRDAIKYGETPQRIFLLNAWRETDLYSAEDKAILALTEEVTIISQHGVSDAVYKEVSQYFDAAQIAQLIMAIVIINAWNRIAISTQMPIEK
ncbi:MAG: carboxymuconolactone decarboxylase family protein [Chitinophagaceae bacterium]